MFMSFYLCAVGVSVLLPYCKICILAGMQLFHFRVNANNAFSRLCNICNKAGVQKCFSGFLRAKNVLHKDAKSAPHMNAEFARDSNSLLFNDFIT
jgi:hypothetical protein